MRKVDLEHVWAPKYSIPIRVERLQSGLLRAHTRSGGLISGLPVIVTIKNNSTG